MDQGDETMDGWIGGWTSCHDDGVALNVCWLMKSLFAYFVQSDG